MLQTDVMARVAEGHLLFVGEGALLAEKLDTRTMLLASEPVSIANEVSSFAAYGAGILRGDFARHCPSCRSRWGDGHRRRWRTRARRRSWTRALITSPLCCSRVGITSAASSRCPAFRSRTPRTPSACRHLPRLIVGQLELKAPPVSRDQCASSSSSGSAVEEGRQPVLVGSERLRPEPVQSERSRT